MSETKGEYEAVNHPAHYNHVPGIECKDVIGWFPGHIAAAMKYLWRCGHKPTVTDIEDLQKAIKFIEFEIERRMNAQKQMVEGGNNNAV